jgi:ABC-type multidrug transport system permease subunit
MADGPGFVAAGYDGRIAGEQTDEQADGQPGATPGWRDVLRSENAKLRSIHRLAALPAIGVVAVLLIGISESNQQTPYVPQIPAGTPAKVAAQIRAQMLANAPDALSVTFAGVVIAGALFGFFGAYCACVEYTGGMIRGSLAAVPRRGRLFGAKLAAAVCAAAPAAAVSVVAVFWIGDAQLGRHSGLSVGAFEGRVLIRVCGAVVYLVGASVIGFALGMLTRSTAASIVILVIAFLFLTTLLDVAVGRSVQEYLSPSLVGERLYLLERASDQPTLPLAYPLYLAWPLALLAGAYLRFTRSDA